MNRFRLLILLVLSVVLMAACSGSDDDSASAGDPNGDAAAADDTDETDSADGADDSTDDDGTDSDGNDSGGGGAFPVTIESAGGTWTLDEQPQRIVSLSPMATEQLFAIGAGDQVVAVDEFSNYPTDAPVTDLSGFDPNIEAITAFEPDLLVLANDANDLIAGLTELDIPVLVSAAPINIEQGYDTIGQLGEAVGRTDETAEMVATLRAEMDAALAEVPDTPIRIYHELDETFYSASSNGFVGAVYAAMGAENIADAADTDGFGFPQLSEEYIVEADPEIIVITDQVTYTPEDVAARPGWEQISAVQNNHIVVVNADTASRWGPRLPQFVQEVANALATVETGA